VVSKLDLVVVVAAIAGGLLWIEHGHRVIIETPAGAAFSAPVATVCPDNENVPYSADCIAFMQGGVASSDMRWRTSVVESAPAANAPGHTELSGPACPANNENVPYTADCIRFLSGWFWRANGTDRTAPASAATPN
jgi:hypothetical protein